MDPANPPAKPARQPSPTPRRPARTEAIALLRRAQAGDTDAFGHLYAAYAANVRRYVTARMRDRDRDAVPDLVQDTFCVALQELHRAHDDVEGWLIQLAARMCTRYRWGQRRYFRAALAIGEQRSHATSADEPPLHPASRALLVQALADLDPRERLTLQLRFLDGQHQATTARIMGCSLWTVKQRQRRALRRLATRLGAEPDALTLGLKLR